MKAFYLIFNIAMSHCDSFCVKNSTFICSNVVEWILMKISFFLLEKAETESCPEI